MKTLIYSLMSLLLMTYSCSSSELEDETSVLSNKQITVEDLYTYAYECGYSSLTIDITEPLTDSDILFYKSSIKKQNKTRGYVSFHKYITNLYYKGDKFTLQFEYSQDNDTKYIKEAYGAVNGKVEKLYGNNYVCAFSTFDSKSRIMGHRFDMEIKAYYNTYNTDSYNIWNSKLYRIIVLTTFDASTNSVSYEVCENGEGKWPGY